MSPTLRAPAVSACVLVLSLIAAACSGSGSDGPADATAPNGGPRATVEQRSVPPIGTGDLATDVDDALDLLVDRVQYEGSSSAIDIIAASGDARVAWLLTDVLRFVRDPNLADQLVAAYATLTGVEVDPSRPWTSAVDQLITWDIPAPPGYFEKKRRIFTTIDQRWTPLFDTQADIDWRYVSWGGVFIDDRPLGDLGSCPLGCIPAIDDPPVTDADGGDWYPDDALVFGVEVDGETRAYPKNIMEVHEMVNDTLGGRRIAMPYCTLCGSAQVYFTDAIGGVELTEPYVLRTSGLLIRSNKMMYELGSGSFVDTFTGAATTGDLRADGVVLDQVSVVTATWSDWKAAHPDTTIVAADGGLGRSYPLDPLQGRDDAGPIFPIGSVDPRLDVQNPVLGVLTDSGQAVAFPVEAAKTAIEQGNAVSLEGIEVVEDAGGLRAIRADGTDASGHQAFWFAWSQFHPDTLLWES